MEITTILTSVAALMSGIVLLSEELTKLTKADGTWAQIQTWAIGFVLCYFAWAYQVGPIFSGFSIWEVAIAGFLVNLGANGLFDKNYVQWFLELIRARTRVSTKEDDHV